MCHNSGIQSAQIDKFVEQGMPQKIVKTVQYTIKKRVAEHKKLCSSQACEETCKCTSTTTTTTTTLNKSITNLMPKIDRPASPPTAIVRVCPFGRGIGVQKAREDIINVGGAAQQHVATSTVRHETYTDALTVGTQWTKKLIVRINHTVEILQSSKIYTLLTKTTQPAHVIAICILSFILFTVWPEIIDSKFAAESSKKTEQSKSNQLAVIAYLGAFATHFGSQIWMTFVSGLSLYFALPRHTFGQCQQILFPKYFALNAILSICMLILFTKFFLGSWSNTGCIQLSALALTAAIEVTVRLYLAPPMLRLMHEKYKIEDAVGSGKEVGGLVQGDLVQCPHYQRIHKMFRNIHMTVAIGNIVTLLCTCLHLYYLASKISFA